jgi:hypothetical protein
MSSLLIQSSIESGRRIRLEGHAGERNPQAGKVPRLSARQINRHDEPDLRGLDGDGSEADGHRGESWPVTGVTNQRQEPDIPSLYRTYERFSSETPGINAAPR